MKLPHRRQFLHLAAGAAALPAPAKWSSYRDAASRGSTGKATVKPGSPRSFFNIA
jgi:hypothetical protein